MTVLEAIQEANAEAAIRTLSFAQLQEFNSFQDSFTFQEWPVNVAVPFSINGTFSQEQIAVKQVINISGWILTRISEDTNDFRSVEIEPKYMEPMRTLAKKFLISLLQTDIVDPEVTNINYTIRPEYQFLNTHVFGCSYQMNLPIIGRVC